MSDDIFVQAHVKGDAQEIPTGDVLACFVPFIMHQEEDFIDLLFDEENTCTIFLDTNSPTVTDLLIERPCGDERLFECVYRVMQLGNFVLYQGEGERFIVLKEDTIAHLPEGMAEALGEAKIAPDQDSFLAELDRPRGSVYADSIDD